MLFNAALRRQIGNLMIINAELQTRLDAAIAANEKLSKRVFLLDFQRQGRETIWTFVRNGEITQIKTMGMLSDDTPEWRKRLTE